MPGPREPNPNQTATDRNKARGAAPLPRLETKARAPLEGEDALQDAFTRYRETNDARLAEIERKGGADPLLEDKLARIDRRLSELQLKSEAPALPTPSAAAIHSSIKAGDTGRTAAFGAFLRTGEAPLERKGLSMDAGESGQLAPPELDSLIEARLARSSPMRTLATVIRTSSADYAKPVGLGADAAWVGETDPRPETAASLDMLTFPSGELYAMPAASQALLDDSLSDLAGWLAGEVETAFAAQESAAFVSGDGSAKPKGFLSYPQADDAARTHGQVGTLTGDASGLDGADALISLIHAPESRYRGNGRFAMNRRTLSALRKLKDGDGRYLWAPGQGGDASTLAGYPVAELEDMPDLAAGAPAIAFGDWRRFYLVTDRTGVRVLRDPYSAKPFVLFYTTKRVGGGVQDFGAVKLLLGT